ncbi:F-box protein, partial [Enterobacter ludwigii]
FGTGLASAGAAMVPRAGKAVARTGRFVGRWQHRLQHAGGRARRHGVVLMAPEAGKSALEQLPSVALEKIIKSIPGKDIDNLALTSKTMHRNINQLPLNINKIFDVDLVKNAQSMAVVNPGPHYHPSQHLDLDRAFLTAVSGYNGELSGVSRHRFRSAVAEAGLTIEDLQPISYMWKYDLGFYENVNMYIFWQSFKEGRHNLNRLRQIYRPDWDYWFLPEALP